MGLFSFLVWESLLEAESQLKPVIVLSRTIVLDMCDSGVDIENRLLFMILVIPGYLFFLQSK